MIGEMTTIVMIQTTLLVRGDRLDLSLRTNLVGTHHL
jgi:hypothetical protein